MTTLRRLALLLLALLAGISSPHAQEEGGELRLSLPTENDALFRGGGAAFYQHIRRDYKGVISFPWQGGQYGFVRNPVETASGLVYSRFHEGMDIRPVRRDARGEPLDPVRAIAEGKVVHINLVPGYSNYGKYVVVEHRWGGSSYYSLYGHLATVTTSEGAKLERGEQLGVMGYTGEGLDQSRAHVHVELNLLLSRNFESWHEAFFKSDPNRHGLYNGINLTGIDLPKLLQALRKRSALTIPEFLEDEDVFYRVALPPSANFDLPRRYPWLLKSSTDEAAQGWEVSFNRAGVPLRVKPLESAVAAPTLTYVDKRSGDYSDATRGVIGGSGAGAHLTASGQRLIRLLIWPD
ncbi:MAG TPA: M23 family metallopeptidase [Chthoniobacterales bacterium]